MVTNSMLETKIKNEFKNSYIKYSLTQVFKNWFFIYFSFVNLFTPLFSTIIASLKAPHATLNIVAIGLTTGFLGIFNELLFLISITMIFIFNQNIKKLKNKSVDKHTIALIMLIYSIVITFLFAFSTLLYMNFSTLYIGFKPAFDYSLQFVLLLLPTFVINTYIYILIAYGLFNKLKQPIWIFSFKFLLNLTLIPLFYLPIDWTEGHQLIGIGLGYLLTSIITFVFAVLINKNKVNFKNELKPVFNKESLKLFFHRSGNFVIGFAMSSMLKAFLTMIMGLSLKYYSKEISSSLMITKVIWLHSLYFCGFFTEGLLYSIEYSELKEFLFGKDKIKEVKKVWGFFVLLSIIITLIICVLFNAIAYNWLTSIYTNPSFQKPEWTSQYGGHWLLTVPDINVVKNLLWSSQKVTKQPITGDYTYSFTLMYVTIQMLINSVSKIISIKPIVTKPKFNWKAFLYVFLTGAFQMTYLGVFSCAFKSIEFRVFLNTFNGLDAFTFAYMSSTLILSIFSIYGFCKRILCNKIQNK